LFISKIKVLGASLKNWRCSNLRAFSNSSLDPVLLAPRITDPCHATSPPPALIPFRLYCNLRLIPPYDICFGGFRRVNGMSARLVLSFLLSFLAYSVFYNRRWREREEERYRAPESWAKKRISSYANALLTETSQTKQAAAACSTSSLARAGRVLT
jgi:hypothetical protein